MSQFDDDLDDFLTDTYPALAEAVETGEVTAKEANEQLEDSFFANDGHKFKEQEDE